MSGTTLDLNACDREPIHIPGAIQPHGVLLVVDAGTLQVTHAAGDVGARLGVPDWIGRPVSELLGDDFHRRSADPAEGLRSGFLGRIAVGGGARMDVSIQRSDERFLIELEPPASGAVGSWLGDAGSSVAVVGAGSTGCGVAMGGASGSAGGSGMQPVSARAPAPTTSAAARGRRALSMCISVCEWMSFRTTPRAYDDRARLPHSRRTAGRSPRRLSRGRRRATAARTRAGRLRCR